MCHSTNLITFFVFLINFIKTSSVFLISPDLVCSNVDNCKKPLLSLGNGGCFGFKNLVLPNPIVKLFFNSWSDYKESIAKIRQFHELYPDVLIVPTHCEKTTKPIVQDKINFDAL